MALFVKYLSSIEIYTLLEIFFGNIRRNNKGLSVWNIFKQIFCWFYYGTSRYLNYLDQLKGDEGYASIIENDHDEMTSSHQMKRFFKSFSWVCGGVFRKILRKMFIWRLRIEKPDLIVYFSSTKEMQGRCAYLYFSACLSCIACDWSIRFE
jgi:hypothetical protein